MRPRWAWHFAVPTGIPSAPAISSKLKSNRHGLDHLRLRRRDLGQRAPARRELGDLGRARGVAVGRFAAVLLERLAAPRKLTLGDVAAGVDDEPVQPGRERGLAAELRQLDAELCERVLGGVARVLAVTQQMVRQPLDARRVPLAERCQRAPIAVFRSLHQNRVAQPFVDQRLVMPEVLTDWTRSAHGRLHRSSLRTRAALALGGGDAPVPGRIPRDRADDPQARRLRDPRRPRNRCVVGQAARAEAQRQPGGLAEPDSQRAALDDP